MKKVSLDSFIHTVYKTMGTQKKISKKAAMASYKKLAVKDRAIIRIAHSARNGVASALKHKLKSTIRRSTARTPNFKAKPISGPKHRK